MQSTSKKADEQGPADPRQGEDRVKCKMFCFLCGFSVAWFRSLWSYIVCNCFFFCRNLRGRKRNLLPIILWEEMSCWMTAHKKKKKKNSAPSYNFSALHLVHDPQEFAENLFRPLVPFNIIEGFSYSVQSFGQFIFCYQSCHFCSFFFALITFFFISGRGVRTKKIVRRFLIFFTIFYTI